MKGIQLLMLMCLATIPVLASRHFKKLPHGMPKKSSVDKVTKWKAGSSAGTTTSFASTDRSILPNPAIINASMPAYAEFGRLRASDANQSVTRPERGMGPSAVNRLADQEGHFFNVKAFGAKGDGTANDTAAFQAAWNAAVAAGGGTILVPQTTACYMIDKPINMTSTSGAFAGVTVKGISYKHAAVKVGAPGTICGNTGGIVFDVSGSDGITFRDLDVSSQDPHVTNPSLVGLYAARDSNGNGAQSINVYNCSFKMVSHTSGTTYSFGAYLYGSENDYFYGDTFIADYPLVVTLNNNFGIHSAFIHESASGESETGDNFRSMELDSQGLGPGAYFDATWDMILQGHIFNFAGGKGYAGYSYAIEMTGTNRNMQLNVQQEGYPGFMYLKLSLMESTIKGSDAPFRGETVPDVVLFNDSASQILDDSFDIDTGALPSTPANALYDGGETGVAVIDHAFFACGNWSDCVDIPIGQYRPKGWSFYARGITWSGSPTNASPTILFSRLPIYGSFTIPVETVAAGQCLVLPAVPAFLDIRSGVNSIVALSNTNWYNLIVTVQPESGRFIPKLCNPTSSSITTGGTGTVHWKILQ